ncbi:CAF1 family ribonuclease, putative [Babesia ovis]|uniref:CAF1 family ribonuclease, putative n=1 Tax=Babesia ovis TaxID=5869 RepID=A0A9W5TC53_BABOV|nr:CAF1 family ribonuclease, putative [Babesia ovis]
MGRLGPILDEFKDRLVKAAFVTVDCELSGLTEDRKHITDLDDYLLLLRDGVTTYSLLQVGFCIAVYDQHAEKWLLYPYNFFVYPSEDCIMHLRSATVKWLKDKGFDFMRWIAEGQPFQRLDDTCKKPGCTKRQKAVGRFGLQKFLEAIMKYRKPLVVHNGLLDLYHIYDKFIGVLPEQPQEILKAFYNRLGPAIYDTKYVAKTLQSLGLQEHNHRMCSLVHLYKAYDKRFNFDETVQIRPTACNVDYNLVKSGSGESAKVDLSRLHEAGCDATVTAMIFTAEMSILLKEDMIPSHCIPSAPLEDAEFTGSKTQMVINRLNVHEQIGIDCIQLGA